MLVKGGESGRFKKKVPQTYIYEMSSLSCKFSHCGINVFSFLNCNYMSHFVKKKKSCNKIK